MRRPGRITGSIVFRTLLGSWNSKFACSDFLLNSVLEAWFRCGSRASGACFATARLWNVRACSRNVRACPRSGCGHASYVGAGGRTQRNVERFGSFPEMRHPWVRRPDRITATIAFCSLFGIWNSKFACSDLLLNSVLEAWFRRSSRASRACFATARLWDVRACPRSGCGHADLVGAGGKAQRSVGTPLWARRIT